MDDELTQPEGRMPRSLLALVGSVVTVLVGLLAVAGGVRGAIVGAGAALVLFAVILFAFRSLGLLGARRAVPLTPVVIIALLGGMLLVLSLAVLVLALK